MNEEKWKSIGYKAMFITAAVFAVIAGKARYDLDQALNENNRLRKRAMRPNFTDYTLKENS